jgi:hypothetical protein
VRAEASYKLGFISGRQMPAGDAEKAQHMLLAADIKRFLERPADPAKSIYAPDAPPGSPIGIPRRFPHVRLGPIARPPVSDPRVPCASKFRRQEPIANFLYSRVDLASGLGGIGRGEHGYSFSGNSTFAATNNLISILPDPGNTSYSTGVAAPRT